jgi:hypothetical protein
MKVWKLFRRGLCLTWNQGGNVYAIIDGNATRPATVVNVSEESGKVEVTGLGLMFAYRVWTIGNVWCSLYQIHEAKLHAKSRYPVAEVSATMNAHWGLEPDSAACVVSFLLRKRHQIRQRHPYNERRIRCVWPGACQA